MSMSREPIVVHDQPDSLDNEVKPFQIEGMDVRGRVVRLGTAADQIIAAHDYPEIIAQLVGETIALAALLGSILKYDGMLTIQAKGKGPVSLLIADYESPGKIRGYADYDQSKLDSLGKHPSFRALMGQGYLAMTIDQGQDMERYQGIVDLDGDTLSDCAEKYFVSSEQTPSSVRLTAGRNAATGHWRAGGIMVQHLAHGEEGGARHFAISADEKEAWNRARILMESVRTDELLDPDLSLDDLLFRLFNEDGVRVFEPLHLERGCRCSVERIARVLAGFGQDDIEHMTKDGKITVTCQFCARDFEFDPPPTQ